MLRPWSIQFDISQNGEKSVYLRITDCIIESIKNGSLKPGEVLPGSRQMASILGVNRNTVVKAYDILLVEGWLTSSDRKGTFVSEQLLLGSQKEKDKNIQKLSHTEFAGQTILFDNGLPDTSIAPIDELARAYRRIFSRKAKWQMLKIGNELGDTKFREAVSQMLNYNKGMNTTVAELCITRGTQMSLFLISHCLLTPGDIVLVENPGYRQAWDTFQHVGAKLLPIEVDDNGIDVEKIESILSHAPIKAIYLTPHHQFPTTVTLSLSRRLKLIELSNHYGFTIIEDDYDSEFYFGQRPKTPICSHNELNNFVYLSTLSKLIAPAIRIGFMYSSPEFIEKIGRLRRIVDFQGDSIMEQSILELIHSGDIRRHHKRALSCYRHKRDYFAELLNKYLKDKAIYQIPDGGLAFWLYLPHNPDLFEIKKMVNKQGLDFYTSDKFSFEKPVSGIRIGYASISESNMEKGLQILSKYL